jgi:FdrA protein
MKYLMDDPNTKVIVLIAKTPDKEEQDKLVELIKQTPKWVVVNFLKDISLPEIMNLRYCNSLDDTAQVACELLGDGKEAEAMMLCSESYPIKPVKGRRHIRGLYSGGTLCYEALQAYSRKFGRYPASNIASEAEYRMQDVWHSEGDCFIDMGADDFTVGRPHPMIDYSLRLKKIADEGADNEVAVIMIDVVLGYGAHPDPASELVPVICSLPKELAVVCHVLGTEGDPQNMAEQINKLISGGARVFTSHIKAINHALSIVEAGRR